MSVDRDTSQFGWPGDNGIGERLIQKIMAGTKTATCAPKFSYSPDDLRMLLATRGRIVTVVDVHQRPRCKIRIKDVFETTFGNPDARLVRGEGCGNDSKQFQADHLEAWGKWLAEVGRELADDTVLIVEEFELFDG